MRAGDFGIPVPAQGRAVQPECLLIPCLGFDAKRFRLGYGGGYYDRTLAALIPFPLVVGIAFDAAAAADDRSSAARCEDGCCDHRRCGVLASGSRLPQRPTLEFRPYPVAKRGNVRCVACVRIRDQRVLISGRHPKFGKRRYEVAACHQLVDERRACKHYALPTHGSLYRLIDEREHQTRCRRSRRAHLQTETRSARRWKPTSASTHQVPAAVAETGPAVFSVRFRCARAAAATAQAEPLRGAAAVRRSATTSNVSSGLPRRHPRHRYR